MAFEAYSIVENSSATNSTLGNASGGNYGVGIYPTGTGNITITGTTGMGSYLDVDHSANIDITITDHMAFKSIGLDHYGSGTGTLAITDHYGFYAGGHSDGATATLTLTNNYGFYFDTDTVATNQYAFYDASNSLSVFGDIQTQAVSITDNKITATRSNDDLFISANGTGAIHIAGDDSNLFNSTLYSNLNGTPNRGNTIIATVESIDAASVPERSYNSIIAHNTTLTGSGSASNFRPRAISANSNIDLAGFNYTNTSFARGPSGANIFGQAENSGAGASTLATLQGIVAGAYIQDYSNNNQDITVTNAMGVRVNNGIENNGTGALTLTNAYDFYASAFTDNQSSGSSTITNHYAFYTPGTGGTNNYAFYSADDTAVSRIGSLERYREEINTLTSSSTITVDCGLAPVHTVALGTNTGFVITNLGTGQSVTIIIKSSGTYTATFGTDGSTAVKFPGGAPTITDSGTDVVTIFNDGTDYLGNIAQAYA
jgi:hypothetical protein